jgi:UrcA family protein
MFTRKVATMAAAGFIGALLVAAAVQPAEAKGRGNVTITAQPFDPATQRRVDYADLNIAERAGQKALRVRIFRAASDLCGPTLGYDDIDALQQTCVSGALGSTRGQVRAAIQRAKMQLAGLPVGPAVAISMSISGGR